MRSEETPEENGNIYIPDSLVGGKYKSMTRALHPAAVYVCINSAFNASSSSSH